VKGFVCALFVASIVGARFAQPALSIETLKSKDNSNAKDCWLLQQLNPKSPYSQSQVVLINEEGVNVAADDVKLFVVPPDYLVSFYNRSSRECYRATAKEWTSKYGARPFSQSGKWMKKGINAKIDSLPANQYFMMQGPKDKAGVQREIWTTEAIKTSPNVIAVLQHICGLAQGSVKGVPLKVTRFLDGGHKEVLLHTISVRRIATPKNAFVEPIGYKKVKSEIELMMNYDKNSGLKDLLDDKAAK